MRLVECIFQTRDWDLEHFEIIRCQFGCACLAVVNVLSFSLCNVFCFLVLMVCAFFRDVLILVVYQLSLVRGSGTFNVFPVVTLLGCFHIESEPALIFN